ncbi:MAG: hypothetical protein RLZ67_537 [Actinomycetota bacterium]|jgi:acetyl-CoA C-acetyltransferase
MRTPIYVLGGYQTDFARSYARDGLDISDMMREAIEGALADSGLDAEDIETVHVGNAFSELQRQQGHLGAMASQVVPGLWGKPAMRHEGACASSSLAILSAMAELEAGRYDCALVVGVEEQRRFLAINHQLHKMLRRGRAMKESRAPLCGLQSSDCLARNTRIGMD